MPIEFRCTKCQTLLRTPDDTVGRRAVCPKCASEMEVPYVSAPAPRGRPAPPDPMDESERPVYSSPPSTADEQMAIISMILGVLALCFSCCCLLGLPMAIIGLVLGVKGLSSRHRPLAIAGIVLCSLALLACLGFIAVRLFQEGGALPGGPGFP